MPNGGKVCIAGEGQYLGSDSRCMADLSQQGMQQWDSSAFIGQNAIEAEQQVPDPVAESTGTLVTVQGFDALLFSARAAADPAVRHDLTAIAPQPSQAGGFLSSEAG